MLLAALAGLVLTFGGACGVGPTSLSLLAVTGPQTPSPHEVRGHVPVPAAAEVARPASRRIPGRAARRLGRAARSRVRRAVGRWTDGVVRRRGPPPLRGPPALVS